MTSALTEQQKFHGTIPPDCLSAIEGNQFYDDWWIWHVKIFLDGEPVTNALEYSISAGYVIVFGPINDKGDEYTHVRKLGKVTAECTYA